jgi:hypothetical protein
VHQFPESQGAGPGWVSADNVCRRGSEDGHAVQVAVGATAAVMAAAVIAGLYFRRRRRLGL